MTDVATRTVTLDLSMLLRLLEPLRLAHIYALKDSHPEELPEDFKPHKWDGHEIPYAENASQCYRELLDALTAEAEKTMEPDRLDWIERWALVWKEKVDKVEFVEDGNNDAWYAQLPLDVAVGMILELVAVVRST